MRISNKVLQKSLAEQIKTLNRARAETIAATRAQALTVDASLKKLKRLDLDWFGTTKLYVRVNGGTKAHFTNMVEKIAKALGESPDVAVSPNSYLSRSEYVAEFKANLVHVFLADPTDCKLIEEEITETRKVLRPHPSCIAALQSLEQAG